MTITYQFNHIDEIDQNFIQSLKAAFKGKSIQVNMEVIEVLPEKIEAAIQRVENGGELIEIDLQKYESLVKDI
jgi:hypothetical protein